MSNYIKTTDFAAKDALPSGNPNKVAQGTHVDTEFNNIATAIATKEDTSNKGVNNGYASLDSSGDVPDAQISSNFPRLNANAVFTFTSTGYLTTQATIALSSGAPIIVFNETVGSANNKIWAISAQAETMWFRALDDAGGSVASWMEVNRTTSTIDSIDLRATAIRANSNTIWHAGNDGSGSGLDADTVDGQHASAFAAASHGHDAGQVTSGTFADARISLSSVQQHQANMNTRVITGKTGIIKTLSTSAPSGGADGDIWYRYV